MASSTDNTCTPLHPPHIPTTSNAKAKSNWANLPTSSQYVRRTGWEHRVIPAELTQLPEDMTIPGKLQEIIIWSLMPGSDWSWPTVKSSSNIFAMSPQRDVQRGNESCSISTADNSGIKTPSSSVENVSTVSYNTSRTHLSSSTRARSPNDGGSMRTKLLTAIGLSKGEEKPLLSPVKSGQTTAECTSCFEELSEGEMIRLKSCQHWYCKSCLSTLIITAMVTEATFPPKCCLSPIPLQQVLKALDSKQREKYQVRAAEYAVPTTDRWYCPSKDCLKWIPASKLRLNKALGYDCPHCATKLCTICRGPAHPSKTECPQDFGLEATLETAEIEGWQRCYKCQAMVEHNSGCRHMTCRCKAQFCYVCGRKWQTCLCTETDASNKRAGAQRRRAEKEAKVDAEAREIAQAIAEIEEMERREARERLVEEERRQREEEEQLRLMESQRLEEERQKKEKAEQAEVELRMALVTSFEEEWSHLEQVYYALMAFQLEALESRHKAEDTKLGQPNTKEEEASKEMYNVVSQILTRNAARRHARMAVRHREEAEALAIQQEEEEDDMFLQVQMRLRGKSNKESRMERMLLEIKKQHEDETNDLIHKQEADLEKLEKKIQLDTEGLTRWHGNKLAEIRDKQVTVLQKFGYAVGADQQYFDLVFERRRKMLSKHGSLFLNSIANGEDPTGLTEHEASQIEPFLPGLDDGEPGPSGIVRKSDDHQRVPSIQIDAEGLEFAAQESHSNYSTPHRPPIPGSFPLDASPTQHQLPVLPPRPQRLTPPPQIPPPPPPQFVIQPLRPRKPVPSSHTNLDSTPFRHQTPPTSHHHHYPQRQQQQQQQQTQSHHHHQQVAGITSTLAMASLAAGVALGSVTQQLMKPPRQPDTATKVTSTPIVTVLEPQNDHSGATTPANRTGRDPNVWLGAKKSKWSLKKSTVMTDEEMRRRLRQTVGDGWA